MVGLTQRIRSVHHIAPTSVIGIAHGDRKLDLPNRERTRRTTFQILHVDGEARLCPLERTLLLLRDF